jgi:hypothetical protein
MIKSKGRSDKTVGRAAWRLLQSLSEPGARGAPSDVEEGAFVVVAPRKGVTIVRASVPTRAVQYAVAQGFARWDGVAQAKRLHLTQEGRAYVRRMSSVSGAEPFRAQHSPIVPRTLEKGQAPLLFNDGESPLAWLARRKGRDGAPFLAPPLVQAGERFRRDVTQAQILQRVTANWEASIAASRRGGDGGAQVSDVAIDARRCLSCAVDAVGPDLAGLLTDVCGYLKGLEEVETERGWPRRSGKVVLKIALERLARHYGLASEARGPRGSLGVRQWGAEGYRPSLDAAEQ